MAVLTNVLLGMQIPMTSYQQVCYCITNDVIMSISLMYEKPEWGASINTSISRSALTSYHRLDAAQATQCQDR